MAWKDILSTGKKQAPPFGDSLAGLARPTMIGVLKLTEWSWRSISRVKSTALPAPSAGSSRLLRERILLPNWY